MKLLIHASLFASGSIEVDTDTHEYRFLVPPLVKDDQAMLTGGDPQDAARAGLRALAALHKAIADIIYERVAGVPMKDEPVTLTNVLGGTEKASA